MNTNSEFASDIFRTLLSWAGILVLCFALFGTFIVPVSAAGGKGWVEVRTEVPDGFDKHVVVCVINNDTGEEYATRLMAVNGYVSQFNLPAGNYTFDGAFLENSDFRYNTSLVNEGSTFQVAASEDTSAEIELKTTFNDDFAEGAVLVPPTVETLPPETTEATVPSEPSSGLSNLFNSLLVQNNGNAKPNKENESTSPTDASTTVSATEESKQPDISDIEVTVPSENSSDGKSILSNNQAGNPFEVQNPSKQEVKQEETESTEEAPEETPAQAEAGLTWWQKTLYGVLAAALFAAIIFGFAYFYRRHWLEN